MATMLEKRGNNEMDTVDREQYLCNKAEETPAEQLPAVEWPQADCVHYFSGASRKRAPFRGWAGAIDAWPRGKPPVVGFGKWTIEPGNEYGGGDVRFTCRPFALVMWGANSEQMRVKDKTTHFGFAGLARNGQLRVAGLPSGVNARAIFDQGGWQPPSMETLLKKFVASSVEADSPATLNALRNLIDQVRNETCSGYGIPRTHFDNVLSTWPQLHELTEAMKKVEAQLVECREEAKKNRLQQAINDVKCAVENLVRDGVEVTQLTVAAQLVPSGKSGHEIKEKARQLRKILGESGLNVPEVNLFT
jgi:hypothetical protein